ncbi:AraC family transcriptional regulator [Streptomyces sp. 5K101]|uniref:AraC family transcriptional regulator n=1 Tax=Streptomyces sp. 5K101 TaxID=3390037 RepID=UPI0039748DEA
MDTAHGSPGTPGEGWARYWRDPDRPLEAMRAHFFDHVYHPHSHDAYSFGITEAGAQRFHCRGGAHTSGAGMVMAFNPDEPHDGQAAADVGYQYRIVHIGPDVVRDALADMAGGRAVMPLFPEPALSDPVLRDALLRLHTALVGDADPLVRDELLTAAVTAMVARGTARPPRERVPGRDGPARLAARRARALLEETYAEKVTAEALAEAAGCSRFALYRAFRAEYGMSPSDWQRLVRLRRARGLLAAGTPAADAAVAVGFADQSHFHRWFVRCFGVTPGLYQRAGPP